MAQWLPLIQIAAATTTWNPSDKNANITLSNGNLTATNTFVVAFQSLRAVAAHSIGKYYFESHIDAMTATTVYGIGNATASLSNFTGSDLNSIGWNPNGGDIYLNGSNFGPNIQGAVTGDTVSIAVDMGNTKIWFRTNGGNWNNDVIGNQNPATNTGGINFSTMNAGPWLPMGTFTANGNANTADFGATAYAQSVPSGFGNW